MIKLTRELSTYAIVSGAAWLLDILLMSLLIERLGWNYLLAAATSFVAGGITLYLLCIRFVFLFRRIDNPVLELPYFLLIGLFGLLLSLAVMYGVVTIMGLHFLVGKIAASGFTFGANYLLRRHLLFSSAGLQQK